MNASDHLNIDHDWTRCPICGESDMRRTFHDEGAPLIDCVNHVCGSNGGTNFSALTPVGLELKAMASAPKPREDEDFRLLVLDEWMEMGQPCRGWTLVYWLDAFDGRPAGWHGQNCADLRHPVGWILRTSDLPTA